MTMRAGFRLLAVAGLAACGRGEPPVPPPPRIEWTADVQAGLARAKAEGRPVLIAFVSSAASICRDLESGPFADPRVIEAARPFVAVRVDLDTDKASARAYHAAVVPDVRFLDTAGRETGRMRNRPAGEAWDAVAVAEQIRAAGGGGDSSPVPGAGAAGLGTGSAGHRTK
jgi:hypothetical protein